MDHQMPPAINPNTAGEEQPIIQGSEHPSSTIDPTTSQHTDYDLPQRTSQPFSDVVFEKVSNHVTEVLDNSHEKEEVLTQTINAPTTFEDLLEFVGTSGRWNFKVILVCLAATFPCPFQTMSYQFLGMTPDHWCQVPELIEANWTQQQVLNLAIPTSNTTGERESCVMYDYNYTLAASLGYEASIQDPGRLYEGERTTRSCSAHYFNTTHPTTVTQWDLVCERRILYSATFSIPFIVFTVNCPIIGIVIDSFGRRWPIVLSSMMYSICCFLSALPSSYYVFLLLRVLTLLLASCYYFAYYVLSLEICSVSQRSMVGNLFLLSWALGYMALPGVAYLVRHWRWLQAALSIPTLIMWGNYWLIPESPRWLITKGRLDEAADLLVAAARINNRHIPPRKHLLAILNSMHIKRGGVEAAVGGGGGRVGGCIQRMSEWWSGFRRGARSVVSLINTPRRIFTTAILLFNWFVSGTNYYGISFISPSLKFNPYLYTFLSGLLEVPSYVLLWPAVVYFGRRKTNVFIHFVCGCSLLLIPILQANMKEGWKEMGVFLALVGKLVSTSALSLAYLITGELYPTLHRTLAICIAYIPAGFGASAATVINDVLIARVWWAPSVVFSVLALSTSLLSIFIPETYKITLPDVTQDLSTTTTTTNTTTTAHPSNPSQVNQEPTRSPLITKTSPTLVSC